jgi:HEAT repeat protein
MERWDYDPNIERLEEKRDVKGLTKAYKTEKHPIMRARIIRALGYLGDLRALETLIDALKEPEVLIHSEAMVALRNIGEPAVEPLIKLLEPPYRNVQIRAAETLGKIGDKRAIEPLIRLLDTEYLDYIRHAATALGEIGDPRAIEPLVEKVILRDGIGMYRDFGAFALREIGEPALDHLIKALNNRHHAIRLRIVEALRTIGHRKALEPLLRVVREDVHPEVRGKAELAVLFIGQEEGYLALKLLYNELDHDAYAETYNRIANSIRNEGSICTMCGFPLPREITCSGGHHPTCPWAYYITCKRCGYQNNLSYLLGYGQGCSEECRRKSESQPRYTNWELIR